MPYGITVCKELTIICKKGDTIVTVTLEIDLYMEEGPKIEMSI